VTKGQGAVTGRSNRATTRRNAVPFAVALFAVVGAAGAEVALGREPICTCGAIKLWHGVVQSAENSQHLSDWYTPSHIVHGIGFYALTWFLARRLPLAWRFAIAVAVEAAWEVFENTPFVIERYRAATISLDYYGDSIVNSMADIGAMTLGFAFAASAQWWVSVAAVMAMELFVAVMIRDNLFLNILMLIHPFDAIKRWQAGA
jgi:hypothetical protein